MSNEIGDGGDRFERVVAWSSTPSYVRKLLCNDRLFSLSVQDFVS